MHPFLIGAVAGLASALLFASTLSGSPLALVLSNLAATPIMIAGLGWRHVAGLVATVVASLAVVAAGALAGDVVVPTHGLFFAATIGLPAWILSYLALLGRSDGEAVVEWFGVGGLVAVAALIAAALGVMALLAFGPGREAFESFVSDMVETVLRLQFDTPAGQPLRIPDVSDAGLVVRVVTAVVPPLMVSIWLLVTLFNLYISARVVRVSGRLVRPWPSLAQTRLPRWALPLFAAATLLGFVGGTIGLVGELFGASLFCAFVLQGLAVVHALTQGSAARTFVLGGFYLLCLLMTWVLIAVGVLGLADAAIDLRTRMAARRPRSPS